MVPFFSQLSSDQHRTCYNTDDIEEELYNGDPKTPIFKWSTQRGQSTIEQLARVRVLEDVEPHKVCSGTPMSISHNVAFAVNLEEVGGLGDLKADEMGVWDRQGAGRKGGVPKRKRTKKPAKIETRSKRTNVSVQPTAVCPPPLLATTVIASSPVTIATPSTPPILSQTTALSMNAAQQAYPYSHGGYSSNTQQTIYIQFRSFPNAITTFCLFSHPSSSSATSTSFLPSISRTITC